MMNIIGMRQEKRAKQIGQIKESIKKARAEGKEIDKRDIIFATMASLNLSRRTAAEYVEVALYSLNTLENGEPTL